MSVTDEQTALAKARLKARNLARVVREQQSTIERLEARVRELEASRNRGAHGAVPQGTRDAGSAGTDVPRADERVPFPSTHDSKSRSRSRREGDIANAVTRGTRPKGRVSTQARGTRDTATGGGVRPGGGKGSGTRRDRAGGADATTARERSW